MNDSLLLQTTVDERGGTGTYPHCMALFGGLLSVSHIAGKAYESVCYCMAWHGIGSVAFSSGVLENE